MTTVKPIIIYGTGRCGSTIFHHMLSRHSQFSWLSGFCAKWPEKPILNRTLMQMIEFPFIGRKLRDRFRPDECYQYWDNCCLGFRSPFRDLVESDLTTKNQKAVRSAMAKISIPKRDRLLLKITGWPRICFLRAIFEDAKFIHIIRDGRSVTNSMLHVDYWRGWQGPENWRWGPLSDTQYKEWLSYDRSFVVLAALQWKILMNAAEKAKKGINPENLIEIKYEDFCSSPFEIFKRVIEFSELSWDRRFEKRLGEFTLHDTTEKWKQDLSLLQQKQLNEVLAVELEKYGYT